ncbi:adenylate kinase [Candidatus Peregrinibacteria bacterium]|nr:adenylate kinase [Candidatus Peregrinibacteria bacterium]
MDLVLFGIQGSGKGTQAKLLAKEFGYHIFETGAELRKIAASGTELGNSVKSYIDAGNLAPHEIVMEVVREAVAAIPPDQKILFDGIPRDLVQMADFDRVITEAGRSFRCLQIVADAELCIQRILSRAQKEGRADDQQETSIRRRMQLFTDKTVPVIETYRAQGKMIDVDGEGTVEEVYGRVKNALDEKF